MATKYTRAYVNGDTWSVPETSIVTVLLTSGSVDTNVFTADVPMEVVAVREVHSVAGAASSTLDVKKCTGTTAPASGTTVLASTFALDSTANTPVTKNVTSGLSATAANRKLAVGDRLAIDMTGTITSLVGSVNIYLRKLQSPGADR
jgi:hypothetical protein